MPTSGLFGSTEAVIDFLWDITFLFFVIRLSFVYAVLSAAASAAVACLAHAAILPFVAARQNVGVGALVHKVLGTSSTTKTALVVLVSAVLFSVVGLCGRFMMGYAKIPQLRGFRIPIGVAAAVYVGLGWLAASEFVPACRGKTATTTPKGHGVVPADNALTLASFCQSTRLRVGGIASNTSVSACTIVGLVFVAAVALVPWLSMVLLERPNRRYGRHRRTSSNIGWLRAMSPSPSAIPVNEKSLSSPPEPSTSTDDSEDPASPKKTSTTRVTRTPKKRYSLRNTTTRRTT
ncbi:uncharacterized protein SPSK_09671 [Sporothrix schenckii 1099-18]|uniref:Uncharacterized protein n=2 Tax=Sporothrix schenckii TaxID=29908 RepID=U7Q5E7_SPOS1|nr:uncharacterized protein SPSK_09671 [Sporothrix schenckii 1099-18]ERT03063.1 hypothetical protein HMPREF1624_01368 [Sporothrix schenckii ATCC 58251]KJR84539.1 hypothetical protein SPSK_09671 [Sporothrix schenckii 1099-18]